MEMIKNNLGWIVALILVAGQPVLSAVPQLCLWDMYAMAEIASLDTRNFMGSEDDTVHFIANRAAKVANEMIKRRSK